ncbi:hypothetical protein JXM83_03945 [Candidatus Woesearchaeota archaeon]|nr:hypothetical protein [Candidatus Woesearchaeota archaeon]
MNKFKRIFTNWKVITLLIVLVFSIIAIHPNLVDKSGVVVRYVEPNSPANVAGILNPEINENLLSKERIKFVMDIPVNSISDYHSALESVKQGQTVKITTTKKSGLFTRETKVYNILIPFSNDTNDDYLGLTVSNVPNNNLILGLDLQGGTSAVLKPTHEINESDFNTLISILNERLNVQGLTDVKIRKTTNLLGESYISLEMAGVTKKEVEDILARQGKFEAKIGNDTVFTGQDVKNIPANEAMITGCGLAAENVYSCRYRFSVTLSVEASEKRAELTNRLDVIAMPNSENDYLSENITFLLDDEVISELYIGSELKGNAITTTAVSGSATGVSEREAYKNAVYEMDKLQTMLQTGKLPVQLEIVDFSEISPKLGEQFLKNSFFVGMLAIIAVALIIFLRFRKLEIAVPMAFTMVSEVVLMLGFAAFTKWNLDLAAIAGIIIAAGTGVDDQIVITDEVLKGDTADNVINWKKRIKNAFFIIMASYFTTLVAMLPLFRAGAGQLRGFALTTIVGISFGVFLTRPAFAAIIRELLKNKKEE